MTMVRMKGSFLFTILILSVTISIYYSLTLLDNIVHASLYNYGLQFSFDWANPYWNTLHIVQVLLGVIATVSVVNAVYTYRTQTSAEFKMQKMPKLGVEPKMPRIEVPPRVIRNEVKPKIEEKKPEIKMTLNEKSSGYSYTAPTTSTIEQQLSGIPPGMVKCGHCAKIFAQPLRMLDFHEDRPKMVSICPFCNEVIQNTPHPSVNR